VRVHVRVRVRVHVRVRVRVHLRVRGCVTRTDVCTAHFECVMSRICICHVTHMNASCHTYECVMSHMNASCHKYECIMSHV